ncbi:alpha/beta hydrolase [Streptomyces sp. 5-10]|uniref:alpha/beta hydrolase n=1 Tax=Streptomyces sp. 5-10 TaxID=878925 RepID=UPI00168B3D0B|nr:alpha/beta hydrolase [Streptomyces sp. 5-10]MBD3004830.1 alpha/beta hydrolase [Streptomyces sp. 5-10]
MKITSDRRSYGSHERQQLTIHCRADHPDHQPRAGLLMIHGGYWATRSGMGDWPKKFAEAGYVVIEAQYRLNSDAAWPAQRDDVRAALDYARRGAAQWILDPERIAAFGSSAGGHLAGMLAVTHAGLKGVVALSPPMSPYRAWRDGEKPTGTWREHRARLRREAEKMAGSKPVKGTPEWDVWVDMTVYQHATGGEPPLWLAHFEDDLIPPAHSVDLMEHLTKTGTETGNVSVETVSGSGHAMSLMETPRVQRAVKGFLAGATGSPQ